VELEAAVVLILPAQRKEAAKVSILRFPIWPGLLTHPIPDPIMLSDDESVGAESETDYSDLDIDPRAKSDSGPPHPDGEPADGNGFGPGTTPTSDSLAADHPEDGSKSNNGIVNDAQLRLSANRPGSASPGHESVTHRASKLRVNTDMTQRCTSYVNVDVTKELEDGEYSVSTEERDEDGDDTHSTKRSKLSAVSDGNMSKLWDDQPDNTQFPQPGPAVTSLHRSVWEIDHLPKQLRRRGATRDVRRKRPRTTAPTRLASTASTVSASLGSTDLEDPKSVALLAAPGQEREIRDIDQEMVNDGGTDDSNDEDYSDMSDAVASETRDRPHFRKRARRAKDTEHNDGETTSTHSLSVSYQATEATSNRFRTIITRFRGYIMISTIQNTHFLYSIAQFCIPILPILSASSSSSLLHSVFKLSGTGVPRICAGRWPPDSSLLLLALTTQASISTQSAMKFSACCSVRKCL
jgi:hypothetical protein